MRIRAGTYRVCSRIDEDERLVLVITINTGNDARGRSHLGQRQYPAYPSHPDPSPPGCWRVQRKTLGVPRRRDRPRAVTLACD